MKRIDWGMVAVFAVVLLGAVAFAAGFLGRERLLMLLLGDAGAVVAATIAHCAFDIWRSKRVAPVLVLATMVATSIVLAWPYEVYLYGFNVVVGVVAVAVLNMLVQLLVLCAILKILVWRYRLSVRPSQPRQPRDPRPPKRRTRSWFFECRWITVAIAVILTILGGLLPPAWRALVWGVAVGCATGLCGVIILNWTESLWVPVVLVSGVAVGGGIALGCLAGGAAAGIFVAVSVVAGVFAGVANLLCPPGSNRCWFDL